MTNDELRKLIDGGEKLTVEFKSDLECLPDNELVQSVVALANTDGGHLIVGVEDNGNITGLCRKHTNEAALSALIVNKTTPHLSVDCVIHDLDGNQVAHVFVPTSKTIVATSSGSIFRRQQLADGKAESVPFYPHEFERRRSFLGQLDISAQPILDYSEDLIDQIELRRVREAVRRYGGDRALFSLEDSEFAKALGLTTTVNNGVSLTFSGLLLIGREDVIRSNIPSYEVAFQVLEGTDVKVNEFFRVPLLQTFEEVERLFLARISEQEYQDGLFRVSIPSYDKKMFREAFVNALVHRDFTSLGAVHVRLQDKTLTISNPGGFVEGVNLNNLLVTEPRPRNPRLADILKRIGLAERTGRGIDRIYEGVLRYGRPIPDYTRSDRHSVILEIYSTDPDIDFINIILTEEKRVDSVLPIDSLIILNKLRQERRLDIKDLSNSIQKSVPETRRSVEKLVEDGILEAHGARKGRTYTLSAKVYSKEGKSSDYVRQSGFDKIQQEQMIISFLHNNEKIKRGQVMELCRITKGQAANLLSKLKNEGKLTQIGDRKAAYYVLPKK